MEDGGGYGAEEVGEGGGFVGNRCGNMLPVDVLAYTDH